MTADKKIASIILGAGRGRRMNAPKTPKICFPIAGAPAVAHLLGHLKNFGAYPNFLVVGHLAGKVIDEIGARFPETVFVYQREYLGTGHATKQGARLLREMGWTGGVLVAAGDKVIEPCVLEQLTESFTASQADLCLVVAPKTPFSSAGRILLDEQGRVARCIEKADMTDAMQRGATVTAGSRSLPAAEAEAQCQYINRAIYLFRAEALYEALDCIGRNNVQHEEYLTDAIEVLVRAGKTVVPMCIQHPDDVQSFNSPEELLEIEEYFRRKSGHVSVSGPAYDPRVFKTPEAWARRLESPDGEVHRRLTAIYGDNPSLCEEKRRHLLAAVHLFIQAYGNEGVVTLVRAPGRVNLMGRHVDHRGGDVNLMAIDREQFLVARARDDVAVRAHNADPAAFGDIEFAGGELLRQVRLDDWREFVNSAPVIQMVRDLQGDWGNYLKAPMLRLQQQFRDRQIRGVDCVVRGDIPMAAGLSSSSALVVAMAEALVLTNGIDVSPHDLVDVCGEGEWFVGTRGGSADHAAVKLSQFGQVVRVGFFPFAIKGYVPFPKDCALVVAHSRIQARKAEGARDTFNERVASYEFSVELVRRRFPNYRPLIQHLRDISQEGLGIRAADLYRLLMDIPEQYTLDELRQELGVEFCERFTATHRPPAFYSLRARLLFGLAECARASRCLALLQDGAVERLGMFMNISHDGDRVCAPSGEPYRADVSSAALHAHIEDLQSEDPERVLAAQFYLQPGAYACSIPAIDRMVDLARQVPGVLGAQLSGAGLGGCMMVLAKAEAAPAVVECLNQHYYEPNHMEPGAFIFTPIAGCGPFCLEA